LLGQILFFDSTGLFAKIGTNEYATGRKETFIIEEHERLIGFEIDHGARFALGITLIKWKI
jgi:hypothetical protein